MNTPDPLTPSPDSPTPRTDALGVDEWILPDNRLVVSIKWKDVARQLERENAALVKERSESSMEREILELTLRDEKAHYERMVKICDSLRATLAERDREVASEVKERDELQAQLDKAYEYVDQRNEEVANLKEQINSVRVLRSRDSESNRKESEHLQTKVATLRATLAERDREIKALNEQVEIYKNQRENNGLL